MKSSMNTWVEVPAVCVRMASGRKPGQGRYLQTLVLSVAVLLAFSGCDNSGGGGDNGGGGGAPAPIVLSITTSSLQAATEGTAYSVTLQATGGTTPYQWSVLSGALPPGLTIGVSSGILAGTPTANGMYSFTVRVQDAASPLVQATQPFNLTVYAASPPFSGTFGDHTTYGAGLSPYLVYCEHLNADTNPDIVVVNPVTNQGADGFSVVMNSGSRTFAVATTYDKTPNATYSSLAFLDLDADGLKDSIVADPDSSGLYLYKNTGTGFSYQADLSYYSNQHPYSLGVGDVDGDGSDDLVVGSYEGSQGSPTAIEVRIWNTNGTFAPSAGGSSGRSLTKIPYRLIVGNVNGDARLDVIAMDVANSAIAVMLGENSPYLLSAATLYSVGTAMLPASLAVGDINGDGKLDVATANGKDGSVSLMAGDGSGSFSLAGTLATGAAFIGELAIGDLNGDGQPDIVSVSTGYATATTVEDSGNVSVYLHQTGFTFAAKVDYSVGEHPRAVVIADVDVDGKPDIITANAGPLVVSGASTVSVLYGQ